MWKSELHVCIIGLYMAKYLNDMFQKNVVMPLPPIMGKLKDNKL